MRASSKNRVGKTARRSPRSLNAVVRNKASVPKDLPYFRPEENSPRLHSATTLSPNGTGDARNRIRMGLKMGLTGRTRKPWIREERLGLTAQVLEYWLDVSRFSHWKR